MSLKYIGDGKFITGIPAGDLTDDEITSLAGDFLLSVDDFEELLIQRGIYTTTAKKQAKKQDKISEDK
jgi:hypothetical protein